MTGMEPAVVAAITSAASTGLSVVQSRQQTKSQSRTMAEQARVKLESIEKQREISRRQARDQLRRDVATQRARFGASGFSSSRSADAILANLQRETERRLADQDWFYGRDRTAIDDGRPSPARSSLLEIGQRVISGAAGISNQLSRADTTTARRARK